MSNIPPNPLARLLLRQIFDCTEQRGQNNNIATTKLTTPLSPPSQGGDKGEVKYLLKLVLMKMGKKVFTQYYNINSDPAFGYLQLRVVASGK